MNCQCPGGCLLTGVQRLHSRGIYEPCEDPITQEDLLCDECRTNGTRMAQKPSAPSEQE